MTKGFRKMVYIPAGTFWMGSRRFYPEEQPVHQVRVDAFWMDAHPVTNAEFARFAGATGYLTVAERRPDPADYPGVDPALITTGSLVFRQPAHRRPPEDYHAWWAYVAGACWRRPEGPESGVDGREHHPVVHVAWEDVEAYAAWVGKALPTEAEWEFAARGGLDRATYVWGDEFAPGGEILANTWQGEFPWQNLQLDGFERTSPVGSFRANGYGLYDMAGNVWEWTSDFYDAHLVIEPEKQCCIPRNRRATATGQSSAKGRVDGEIPRKVLKGGSHLCAPNYCLRYRPAARQPQSVDSAACHIGFRCVIRAP